jgi:hypothetical protein
VIVSFHNRLQFGQCLCQHNTHDLMAAIDIAFREVFQALYTSILGKYSVYSQISITLKYPNVDSKVLPNKLSLSGIGIWLIIIRRARNGISSNSLAMSAQHILRTAKMISK